MILTIAAVATGFVGGVFTFAIALSTMDAEQRDAIGEQLDKIRAGIERLRGDE